MTLSPGSNHGHPAPHRPRRLIVLGSTGSIGCHTLEVVEHLNHAAGAEIETVGLAAGRHCERLIQQAIRFGVEHLAIADPAGRQPILDALPHATVFSGEDAAEQLVREIEATDVVTAMVGAAGLPATLTAIDRGCTIALANKETLVAAGELVTPRVRRHGATLIPVDSEHSAIFQCLEAAGTAGEAGNRPGGGRGTGQSRGASLVAPPPPASEIPRLILTASGGPFRTWDVSTIAQATVEQALDHPTWAMGPKITVDSASMMNKALEVIEAHWLFGVPADRIEVIVHPQSVVHSFVELADHCVLAQLGPPDMRTPIQYALTYPRRPPGCGRRMDWATLSRLTFEPPDEQRFPALALARQAIQTGGTAGAVLNAANEAAVEAFLARRIRFGRIVELASEALEAVPNTPAEDVQTILEADRQARSLVNQRLAGRTAPV